MRLPTDKWHYEGSLMPHPKLCRIPCRSIQHNLSRSLNMIHLRYSILQDSSLADTKSRYSCLRCCPNNHCELGQTDNFHRLSTPLIPTLFYICLGCSLSSFPPSCRCTLDDMFQASSLHRSNTARIPTMTCTCLKRSLSKFPPSCRCTLDDMFQASSLRMSRKRTLQDILLTDTSLGYSCLLSCLHNLLEPGQTDNHCMSSTPLSPTIACISLSGRSNNLIRHPHRHVEEVLEFRESNCNHSRCLPSHTDSIFRSHSNRKDLVDNCNPASNPPQYHEAAQNIAPEDKRHNCLSSYPHTRSEYGQSDSFHKPSTPLIQPRSYIFLLRKLSSFLLSFRRTRSCTLQASSFHRSSNPLIQPKSCISQ